MKFILSVTASDSDYNANCDYALVELDLPTARTLLRRMAAVAAGRKRNSDLLRVSYWSNDIMFFAHPSPKWVKANPDVLPDRGDCVAVDDTVHETRDTLWGVFESNLLEEERTELRTVHVYDDSIVWEASPRHSDIRLETAGISRTVLRDRIKEEVRRWSKRWRSRR